MMAIALRAAAGNSSGGTSPASVLMPSGSTQDDIIIGAVCVCSIFDPISPLSWPGDWTVLSTQDVADLQGNVDSRIEIAWKKFNTGDGTSSVTLNGISGGGWVAASVGYSGVDLTLPVVQHARNYAASETADSGALPTPIVTDAFPGLWRVAVWYAWLDTATFTWSSYNPADTERNDNGYNGTMKPCMTIADSNGAVDASAGTSVSATPSASVVGRMSWIGLLNPTGNSRPNPQGQLVIT